MAAATSCSRGASAAARLNVSISGLQAQRISGQPGTRLLQSRTSAHERITLLTLSDTDMLIVFCHHVADLRRSWRSSSRKPSVRLPAAGPSPGVVAITQPPASAAPLAPPVDSISAP